MNTTASFPPIRTYLGQQRAQFDKELDQLLPPADAHPTSIHRALRYSVLAGGKRLRPILALEGARLFGPDNQDVIRLGCALEMIHTFSLIHDDLPALDNDDLRRGKPTSHRAFGEALAVLAGDALAILAFEMLAAPTSNGRNVWGGEVPASARLRVVQEIARALGTTHGLLGGQVADMESTGRATDAAKLEFIHSAKTGALICVSVRAGAIYGGASAADIERVTTFGERIGLAFQIADDLLDLSGTAEAMGKTVGKDTARGKPTYPSVYGADESQRIAERLVDEACEAIEPYGSRAGRLREIAHYLIARKS